MSSHEDVARAVLDRYGTTYADEAGIHLDDKPAPLFQLLVLAELLSARIDAGIALAAAVELRRAGYGTAQKMCDASWQDRVDALGRGHYRRYDERTATQLGDLAALVRDRYDGDLRTLGGKADGDVGRAAELLQEVKGIGATGAAIFLREVQAVWPWVRPYLDDRALRGAERVGLPPDAGKVAGLVEGRDLARLAAGLVRVSLLGKGADPLEAG
jgi:endonuclease III